MVKKANKFGLGPPPPWYLGNARRIFLGGLPLFVITHPFIHNLLNYSFNQVTDSCLQFWGGMGFTEEVRCIKGKARPAIPFVFVCSHLSVGICLLIFVWWHLSVDICQLGNQPDISEPAWSGDWHTDESKTRLNSRQDQVPLYNNIIEFAWMDGATLWWTLD